MELIRKLYFKIRILLKIYLKIFLVILFLNQLLFFNLCLKPFCLIAALPHVILITFFIGSWLNRPSREKIEKSLKFVGDSYEKVKKEIDNIRLNKEEKLFTGNVHLIVTQSKGKGEEDFEMVIMRYNKVKIISKTRLNNNLKEKALLNAINTLKKRLHIGDIIAIVRGGGDTSDFHFDTYRDIETCEELSKFTKIYGVVTVSGIGHATDNFPIEQAVNFAQITPTDAAYRIAYLIDGKTW